MSELSKICSTCCIEKPIEEFCIKRANPDGRNYICRDCAKKHKKRWYRLNRAWALWYKRVYRGAHWEEHLASQRKYDRKKYREDPEFREKKKAQVKANYQAKKATK